MIGDRTGLYWKHFRHCAKVRGHIQVGQLVVRFGERGYIFIAQAQIQGKVLAYAPVVLGEQVKSVGPEMVVCRAKLDRRLLGKAGKKVSKGGPARRRGSRADRSCGGR